MIAFIWEIYMVYEVVDSSGFPSKKLMWKGIITTTEKQKKRNIRMFIF